MNKKTCACNNAASHISFLILKFAGSLLLITAGAGKFFGLNLLPHWHYYIENYYAGIVAHLFLSINSVMYIVGFFELTTGLLLLSRWCRSAAYIAAVWLFAISLNLMCMHLFALALRDLAIGCGYIALAYLAKNHEK